MAQGDNREKRRLLERAIVDIGVRIRRYTLDNRLKDSDVGTGTLANAEKAWLVWVAIRTDFYQLGASATDDQLLAIEERVLKVDRAVDLIQRDLVSTESFRIGMWTTSWLAIATALLVSCPANSLTDSL